MNDIKFVRGRGGLGRALAGKDHISGIAVAIVAANIPATLTAAPYNVLYSVEDADDLDITYTGDASNIEIDALRYQIESIYQQNKKAVIHLQVEDATAGGTVSEALKKMQNNASGEVRQAIALDPAKDWAVADLTPLQAASDLLESEHKPLSIIYACNFVGIDVTGDDLRGLDNKNITVAYGMDGNGKGNALFADYNKSFTCAGCLVGILSKAKVNENIGWVGAFNVNKNADNEFDALKMANGDDFSTLSKTELDALNAKGYVFLIKHVGKAGSYFNDSHTAVNVTDDFAYIENVRSVDKAVRESRVFLLPKLNAPLYVNEDGTLTEDTIAEFRNEASKALENMQRNGEISTFSVTIDPDQDILSSSKITIAISIVPVGVARNIVVNIGLAVRVENV
jgi:hypothetical protein